MKGVKTAVKKFVSNWHTLSKIQKSQLISLFILVFMLPITIGAIRTVVFVKSRAQYTAIPVTAPTSPNPTIQPNLQTYLRLNNDLANDTFLNMPLALPGIESQFTVEGWFRLRKPTSGDYIRDFPVITYNKPQAFGDYGYNFQLSFEMYEQTGTFRPMFSVLKNSYSTANSNYLKVNASSSLQPDTWYHIAAQAYSAGDMCIVELFVNGQMVQSNEEYTPGCVINLQNAQNLTVGKPSAGSGGIGGFYYDGDLDSIRISNIRRYTRGTTLIPYPPTSSDDNTIALYNFEQNTYDLSGNDLTLKLVGLNYNFLRDIVLVSPTPVRETPPPYTPNATPITATSYPTTMPQTPMPYPTPTLTPTKPPQPLFRQIIQNFSFETDNNSDKIPDGWNYNRKLASAEGSDFNQSYEGSKSFRFNSNTFIAKKLQQDISVSGQVGTPFVYSAMIKAENIQQLYGFGTAYIKISFLNSKNKEVYSVQKNIPEGTYDFTKIEFRSVTPFDFVKVRALIYFRSRGTMWADLVLASLQLR